MRPVSARFLSTLAGSHTAAFRARVVAPGQTGVNPAGTEVAILGGDVRLDGGAAIRSTTDLEVDGTGLWPTAADSLLTPYGAELFLERGIAYGGAAVEWVSLGYHRINDVDQDDAPDGPIRITAADRMSMIIDAVLTSVRQFAATDTYGNVVQQLVVDAYPAAVIEWDDPDVAGDALGRSVLAESDRYAFLDELIVSRGKVWYFDHRGVLVIRTPPNPGSPVWIVARGAGGVLVKAARSLSRSGVYNGVLATGEALDTEAPARGLAVDSDPGSPTRWGGPFGKIPREYASPLLTTDGQAQLAAATILRRSLGLPYNVDLSAVPNPALEPDDAIAVGLAAAPVVIPRRLLVADSFTRTIVDGLGTGDTGHSYGIIGAGTTFQVNGGVLKKEVPAANAVHIAINSAAIGRRDFVAYVDVRVPVAATGGALVLGIIGRRDDLGTDYLTHRLEFNVGGTVTAKIARHSSVYGYSEPEVLVGFAGYAPGQWWTVCAREDGDMVAIKAWRRDTETEPGDWLLVSDIGGQVRGPQTRWGLYFWRVTGNTNAVAPQWEVDNWRVYTASGDTLTGGQIHVIDTLTIPLTVEAPMTATTRQQSLVAIGVGG